MTYRQIIRDVLDGKQPPYVPWSCGFTLEARQKLVDHFGTDDVEFGVLDNHILGLGWGVGFIEQLDNNRVRDHFGVTWDRTEDKDIGMVDGYLLPEPTLDGFEFPDPRQERFFADIPGKLEVHPDRFRVYHIGFSLFERAWSLRGMENLLMDFVENPAFVHELLGAIADWNLAVVDEALKYDIDAVYFGDDWGQQQGLIMGKAMWDQFIQPQLRRMYGKVREAGKYQFIHSCGDVDELFEDLIAAGLNCFNPFQPEVMDVLGLMRDYRGRLTFHGGLSTQKTLPYGSVDDVRAEARRLLAEGSAGSYIFAPAHAVEGDVPVENMVAFIEELCSQPGYERS